MAYIKNKFENIMDKIKKGYAPIHEENVQNWAAMSEAYPSIDIDPHTAEKEIWGTILLGAGPAILSKLKSLTKLKSIKPAIRNMEGLGAPDWRSGPPMRGGKLPSTGIDEFSKFFKGYTKRGSKLPDTGIGDFSKFFKDYIQRTPGPPGLPKNIRNLRGDKFETWVKEKGLKDRFQLPGVRSPRRPVNLPAQVPPRDMSPAMKTGYTRPGFERPSLDKFPGAAEAWPRFPGMRQGTMTDPRVFPPIVGSMIPKDAPPDSTGLMLGNVLNKLGHAKQLIEDEAIKTLREVSPPTDQLLGPARQASAQAGAKAGSIEALEEINQFLNSATE